jgi:hypothetical protein
VKRAGSAILETLTISWKMRYVFAGNEKEMETLPNASAKKEIMWRKAKTNQLNRRRTFTSSDR